LLRSEIPESPAVGRAYELVAFGDRLALGPYWSATPLGQGALIEVCGRVWHVDRVLSGELERLVCSPVPEGALSAERLVAELRARGDAGGSV